MEQSKEIGQIKAIVRRRKRSFALIFTAILVLGLATALLLPPFYLSESTILIENQLIPAEYVQTTITGYVEERIQVITQQIMSTTRLTGIIKKFGLYQDMQERYTTAEIIEKMREDIRLKTISAEVIDRRTGRPTSATIAFTLSYEGKNPSTVQKVANELASIYLEQNLKSREQRASNTTLFLEQELKEIDDQIDRLQDNISEFKKEHTGELPEYNDINLQAVAGLNRELDSMNMRIQGLKERKILLEGQLANVEPMNPIVTAEGKTMMNPGERLKYLRLNLISLKSSLSDKHPDVRKIKKEIRELETQVETSDDAMDKLRRLEDLKGRLAEMKGTLGPRHPDYMKLSKEAESLSKELETDVSSKTIKKIKEQEPDNPAYINIATQITSTEVEIQNLLGKIPEIEKKIAEYRKKIANSPLLEKEYASLARDYESARLKYNEIMSKLMEARVAQGMEETQRGERFTIIEPAQLPEKPNKPNRLAIVLIGFVLALGGGVGMAALREATDSSIKTANELKAITGAPMLSVISFMETREEKRFRRMKILMFAAAVIVTIGVVLYLIHEFFMPLDILWIKLEKKIMMMGF